MAGDDLNEPLGVKKRGPGGRPPRRALFAIAGVGFCVAALGIGAFFLFADPRGGEPFVVAALPPPPAAADTRATGSIRPPVAAAAAEPNGSVENGVTVFRADKTAGPRNGPLVIKVPDALGQSEVAAVDKRLVEVTRYGPLPKIAADGARPSEFYARPPVFGGPIRPGSPRIALYIGGLGLNEAATFAAIDRMPAAVSLAFAPYGDHLDDAVHRAKAVGHEVLLQIPMEAFGDPANRPGPHTLRADAAPRETVDDLHWLMSRMTGYAGVANFLGGKFSADKVAMTTMLQEIGERGLLYLDDGTSKRSLGPTLAPAMGVPAARADVVLDASPDLAAVRAALIRLEAVARDKGTAIGMASDLASDLDVIAAFATSLEAKGIALVPVSSLTSTSAPAMAAAP
jgi:polysaccharide deacetylase 2 family uncharacterized protein YibQ